MGALNFLPLYLFGEDFKLDLKLLFRGNFTIHEGGTITLDKKKIDNKIDTNGSVIIVYNGLNSLKNITFE